MNAKRSSRFAIGFLFLLVQTSCGSQVVIERTSTPTLPKTPELITILTLTSTPVLEIGLTQDSTADATRQTRRATGLTPIIIASPNALAVPPELAEFVAQDAIEELLKSAKQGYLSPEGAIVAYVTTTTVYGKQLTPIKVWRCDQGKLLESDTESFFKALGSNRSIWPSFTLYFAFESFTLDQATVDLHTLYASGILKGSRGGNAQKLQTEKKENKWVILSRYTYEFED